MKIYLVLIDHSKYKPTNRFLPLAPLMVGTPLKNNRFEVEIVHCDERRINKYVKKIIDDNPLFVGFSVMTGMQTLHSAMMSKKIKEKRKDIKIVWGGVHPTILPEKTIKEKYIDILVLGEGEETVVELANCLEKSGDLKEIKGLAYKENRKVIINQSRPLIQNLDKYTIDYDLVDVNKYAYEKGCAKRILSYKSSRGCTFNCKFCYVGFNQRKWLELSTQKVVKDIQTLKEKYGVDGIIFYDDLFFINKRRSLDILRKINIQNSSNIRIDMVTEDLIKELVKYKLESLFIGLESGSNRILKLMNKGYTVEKSLEKVKILARYKQKTVYSFIVGFPTEIREETNMTIDFMLKIRRIHPEARFLLGVYVPYPETELYELAKKKGFKEPNNLEGWGTIEKTGKYSPWIDAKKIQVIRRCFVNFSLNIGIINKIMEKRLKTRFFTFPIEIYFFNWILRKNLELIALKKVLRENRKCLSIFFNKFISK